MLLLQRYISAAAPTAKQSCNFIIMGILFYLKDQPSKQSVGYMRTTGIHTITLINCMSLLSQIQ